jgi:fatty-acyl-CoA synthase
MWNDPTGGTRRPADLWDGLTRRASTHRTSLHCWTGAGYETSSWARVVREAELMTTGLRRAGVRPGTRVAAVLTNHPQAVRGLLAVWLAGGAVASLPVPARGMDHGEYTRQLAAIGDQLDPVTVLVEDRLMPLLPEQLRSRFHARSWESLAGSGRAPASPPGPDDLAFIQYSSGSTGTPKGCMLSPRAIAAQLEIVTSMLEARPGRDVGVTWLPLSHDMGLFGCLLTCWWNDIEHYLSTPERFMLSPGTWFGDIAEVGGTLTAGSNTALHLAARSAARTRRLRWRGLTQMRACIIGAERVEWQTLQLAAETLGAYGFQAESLMPAYGLAEATLAVTATPLYERPQRIAVDPVALTDGELSELDESDPAATLLVSAGYPCRGVELRAPAAGTVGEISVCSPSLAMGYYGDPGRTSAHFADEELRTGDLGFVRDGRLYPVARTDDMISLAGRKVYTREIEAAVDRLDGVRHGSTLVGHHDGTGFRLTLYVELHDRNADYRTLAEHAATLAMTKAAVPLDECVFLRRNSLPKTPSGKIQRHRCVAWHQAGRFDPLATVDLASA